MKKQTHLHLGWPEGESILGWTILLTWCKWNWVVWDGSTIQMSLLYICNGHILKIFFVWTKANQSNILNGLYFNPSQPWFHLHLLKTVPCLPLQDDLYSLLFLYTLVALTTDNSDIISSKLTYPFPFKRSGAVRDNGFICLVSSWAPLFTPKWDIVKLINKQHMYTYTNMFKTHTKGSEHLYSSYCILVAFIVYKWSHFCNFSFLKC